MSSSKDDLKAVQSTPHSTKKRKSGSENLESPKKKRKHDKVENGASKPQEISVPIEDSKEKKKKREPKHDVVEEIVDNDQTSDRDLPDAPVEAHTTVPDLIDDGNLVTNGAHTEHGNGEIAEIDESLLQSQDPSCFYEKRLSLQLPIPAISSASTTSSLLSVHLAPLLLTYFPPAEGIVLSFSDPVLSAKPSNGVNLPLQPPKSSDIPRHPPDETFAKCADSFGVCWVWLTATFLVFRPESGDDLKGWTNVTSEGFIGLVSYNYFQTAVGKSRIPKDWTWDGPSRQSEHKRKKARRGKLRDQNGDNASRDVIMDTQETTETQDLADAGLSCFRDSTGAEIAASQTIKVVDVEMVPGHERDKWTLQIEGSLLTKDEEKVLLARERQRFEQLQNRSRSRSKTPAAEDEEIPLMGEDISLSQAESP